MSCIIDKSALHPLFSNQKHPEKLWEELGRVIAAFGFLEETLLKAIIVYTEKRLSNHILVSPEKEKFKKIMETASDTLGKLIGKYKRTWKS